RLGRLRTELDSTTGPGGVRSRSTARSSSTNGRASAGEHALRPTGNLMRDLARATAVWADRGRRVRGRAPRGVFEGALTVSDLAQRRLAALPGGEGPGSHPAA